MNQSEGDKERKLDQTRDKFSEFSNRHLNAPVTSPTKTGLIPMMIFWFVVMGMLYALMTHYLKPKQSQILANGDLVIERSNDGHFYVEGKVNGRNTKFMVDTGASLVTITDAFAKNASILGGVATTFKTANGDSPGRVVEGLVVSVGQISVTNIKVGVGLVGGPENEALLGQSFLSKFDITITKNQMLLRPR